jgi:undecaprenyl pyrophosphate phosphatase UppP
MWLKPAIVIVFLALLVSLASGLVFLMKDQGSTKRTLYSLGVRVTLAAVLLGLIAYGVVSGQLRSKAPWSDVNMPHQELPLKP